VPQDRAVYILASIRSLGVFDGGRNGRDGKVMVWCGEARMYGNC
jgi:hypothetical protein